MRKTKELPRWAPSGRAVTASLGFMAVHPQVALSLAETLLGRLGNGGPAHMSLLMTQTNRRAAVAGTVTARG
ncbi:MAG: hypothetical protein ABR592_04750 [Nitriliruptorales bacterium]